MPEEKAGLAGLAGIAALFAVLAALAKNVENRYYKDQTVYLDGYNFSNCVFDHCVLSTNVGTFLLRSCKLINGCTLQYGPNAARIIRLWNTHAINYQWPDFNPWVGADGSVTIE